MVQQGDFKIELVYADTKIPFKEHIKDGNVYVEVEPDVEYFISIKMTDASRDGVTVTKFFVDEQDLGYQTNYTPCTVRQTDYRGLWTRENGVSTIKALKFTKPRISADGTNVHPNLLMGKVEIKMYEGTFENYLDQSKNFSSSFSAAAVDVNQSGLAGKKKSLRSGEGDTTVTENCTGERLAKFTKGALLDMVTLNYCAALGLIEVGVLEKPDAWTYHRMQRPAELDQGSPRVRPKTIPGPGISGPKTVELFDLSEVGSDDEGAATLNSGPKTVKLFDLSAVGAADEVLDTASLNNSAAPELMEVEVLENPGVADPKTVELFDLSAAGSDNEN
jgi:hypothetical protein